MYIKLVYFIVFINQVLLQNIYITIIILGTIICVKNIQGVQSIYFYKNMLPLSVIYV